MFRRKILKLIHLISMLWFVLCVGYVLVLALHQVGFKWWIIFSLSGHSALLIFLMISLYLFAMFRGVRGTQKIEIEHPLTSTSYYMAFYVATPILGGLAGCIGTVGVGTISQFTVGISLGTLGTTFVVWVVVDPVIGLLEMFSPQSRRHRGERLAQAAVDREEKRRKRQSLLSEVFAMEESDQRRWREILEPEAEKLAALLVSGAEKTEKAEREAVGIGANAWRIGGLSCMRQLRDMAIEIYKKKNQDKDVVDYIAAWWDGIGSWRFSSLV